MEFVGVDRTFRMKLPPWLLALELGQDHGWVPAGTRQPEDWEDVIAEQIADGLENFIEREWDGSYWREAGQRVEEEDAQLLAKALESALMDIPDHDARAHKAGAKPLPRMMIPLLRDMPGGVPLGRPTDYVSAVEWFSGKNRELLKTSSRFAGAAAS